MPIVVGSAWIPCERPMHGISFVSNARRFSASNSVSTSASKIVCGLHHLHRQARVEHVGRRHTLMHKSRFFANMLGKLGGEGDDVVLGLALDLVDPCNASIGIRLVAVSRSPQPRLWGLPQFWPWRHRHGLRSQTRYGICWQPPKWRSSRHGYNAGSYGVSLIRRRS